MISEFAAREQAAEERFLKKEEEYRREECAHEKRMMQMMLQALQSPPMPPQYEPGYPPYMFSTPLPLPHGQSQAFYDDNDSVQCNSIDNYEHVYVQHTYCAYHYVHSA